MAAYRPPVAAETDPVASAALVAEVVARLAADALKQDSATAATDTELGIVNVALGARIDLLEEVSTRIVDLDSIVVPGYRMAVVIQTQAGIPMTDPDGSIVIDDILIEAAS
jgi:hypothetical protein